MSNIWVGPSVETDWPSSLHQWSLYRLLIKRSPVIFVSLHSVSLEATWGVTSWPCCSWLARSHRSASEQTIGGPWLRLSASSSGHTSSIIGQDTLLGLLPQLFPLYPPTWILQWLNKGDPNLSVRTLDRLSRLSRDARNKFKWKRWKQR